tara:strand:- start:1202 stop:1465 length:264 start_codon:yes stop_codon:yes gene_type:complete
MKGSKMGELVDLEAYRKKMQILRELKEEAALTAEIGELREHLHQLMDGMVFPDECGYFPSYDSAKDVLNTCSVVLDGYTGWNDEEKD